ncbi:hypothetical protein [Staphylococcus succinus]|uniref:hypothetical protein n=1 Tax=Staphylococcus succinus TaxID=61015 RepID=UPI000E692B88|nr:hypothetical protein [Staphylococcus succinus]RIN27716.1 hypothetical protein BU067_01535 [Staphylococcus succinus]
MTKSDERKPYIVKKVSEKAKNVSSDIKNAAQYQENSPADYLGRGLKRVGKTSLGKKIKGIKNSIQK